MKTDLNFCTQECLCMSNNAVKRVSAVYFNSMTFMPNNKFSKLLIIKLNKSAPTTRSLQMSNHCLVKVFMLNKKEQ